MPATIQTLIVFALFVVPGFLLRSAYIRRRAHGSVQADLYALAEAVVGSLFLLVASWWLGGRQVVEWAEAGTLRQHHDAVYFFVLMLLLAPYPIGLALGSLTDSALQHLPSLRERLASSTTRPSAWTGKIFDALDSSGLFEAPTVWDQTWNQLAAESRESQPVFVRVRTKSGDEIVGAFEDGSWVGLSPEPRQLYLSAVYREEDNDWVEIPGTKGVLLDGAEVEYLEFVTPE